MHHKATITVGKAAGKPYNLQCSCGTGGDFAREAEATAWFNGMHKPRLGPVDTSEIYVPGAHKKPAAKPAVKPAVPAAKAPAPAAKTPAKPATLAAPVLKPATVPGVKHHKSTLTATKTHGRPYHIACTCGAGGDFAKEKEAVEWYHAHNKTRAAGETKELSVPGAKK